MIERLYRGKTKKYGWLFGEVVSYKKDSQIWVNTDYGKMNYIVDPETVGQYVGNDVNGNRAFEGDIIKNDLGDEVGVIRFGEYRNAMNDDGHACHVGFYVEWHGGRAAKCLRKDVGFWLKYHPIAGNIHDNPELLEVRA